MSYFNLKVYHFYIVCHFLNPKLLLLFATTKCIIPRSIFLNTAPLQLGNTKSFAWKKTLFD